MLETICRLFLTRWLTSLSRRLLLPNLRLKYSLGFLKLMLLIQFPQLRKLHKELRTHVATSSLRALQKQPRQLLVNSQEFTCVFFKSQFGMEHGPIVGSADEREQPQQMLKTIATEYATQGVTSALRSRRFHKDESGGSDKPVLGFCFWSGPFLDCAERFWPTLHEA